MADHTFMNPYTFVMLPKDGKVTDHTKSDEPVFSGEIKCTLIAKTQIAVPDRLKNPNHSETDVNEYDFFRINNKAAIPGSGIRGVVRSVFETLTDSCMHLNDSDDDYFHTRLNKTTPGIIEYHNGVYVLYEAERLRDKEDRGYKYDDKYSTGKIVNITAEDGQGKSSRIVNWSGSSISGVYLRVNQFISKGKKSHPSVFVKREIACKPLDKVYVDRLKVNVKKYEGQYKPEYKTAIEEMENNGGQLPVWYWQDKKTEHYYFAPSQYSRAVFYNQPKDLVAKAKVKSCDSVENACAACKLFGFIGEDSRASHVRFTDAVCTDENCFDKSYILPILSGPMLSSFEFYLDGNGSKTFGPDSEGVTLAGRKFYWHDPKKKIIADDPFAVKKPEMASKMELVKPDSKFEFSVFFDKITDEQLKKLVFALELGDNREESPICHKIGHGKPIGLGSAKIVVNRILKRSYENGIYAINDVTDEIVSEAKSSLFRRSDALQAFLQRVLNMQFVGNRIVDYPRQNKDGDIFKWFADNRGSLRSIGYIEVKQTLPKITDNIQTLRGQLPENKNQGNNNRNYSKGGHTNNYRR